MTEKETKSLVGLTKIMELQSKVDPRLIQRISNRSQKTYKVLYQMKKNKFRIA